MEAKMSMEYVLSPQLAKVWIVKSSSESLNKFLGGGFLRGTVYTIYGRQDRGKSNICADLMKNAAEMGFKVAYIDGDYHGLTVHRIYSIIKARHPNAKILEPTKVDPIKVYDYYQKLLKNYNIDIFWENDLDKLVNRCKEIAKSNEYTVIIVDSVTLFFSEFVSASDSPATKKEGTTDMITMYGKLRESALNSNHLKILVFTTQHASLMKEALRISTLKEKERHKIKINTSDKEEIDLHMGGKAPAHFSDVVIQLFKFDKLRKAEYVKNRLFESSAVAEFEITDRGIQ